MESPTIRKSAIRLLLAAALWSILALSRASAEVALGTVSTQAGCNNIAVGYCGGSCEAMEMSCSYTISYWIQETQACSVDYGCHS